MKHSLLVLPAVLLFGACAGDNSSTKQSPQQPPRSAQSERKGGGGSSVLFARGRVYQITRLQTADQPRGEWRAMGETIREQGSTLTFTELGSGRTVSFTAPHQITAMNSMGDRSPIQGNSENPNDASQRQERITN